MSVFRVVAVISVFFATLLLLQCSLVPQKPVRIEPVARWEPIFFRGIDQAVELSGMIPLRNKSLLRDESERRIWRSSMGLEGVTLQNKNGIWLGSHVTSNDAYDVAHATASKLSAPKVGWEDFAKKLSFLGLFSLETTYDEECWAGIDGTNYVVEISRDGAYRTFMYRSEVPKCAGSRLMDAISEFIGLQFDDGKSECETTEWFPCAKLLSSYRIKKELELK